MKPLEVEILVAELATDPDRDQLYHIAYEGTITDEDGIAVLGGETDTILDRLRTSATKDWTLDAALVAAVGALAGPDRTLGPLDLEVAVLERAAIERGNGGRAFRRIDHAEIAERMEPRQVAKRQPRKRPAGQGQDSGDGPEA
jgi:proteasome alpha subunit